MPQQPGRERSLDGLRGAAILLVLLVHLYQFELGNLLWRWVSRFCLSGWLGVDLFFALSGFLITRLLLAERGSPTRYRDFYVRRALRILPAYYFYLLVVFAFVKPDAARDWIAACVLFVQNLYTLLPGTRGEWRGMGHLWSLAVEEQFYLVWPLLVYRLPARRLPWLCAGVIILASLCKLLMLRSSHPYSFYVFPVSRADALAWGALAAWFWGQRHDPVVWRRLSSALWVLLAMLAVLFLLCRGLGEGSTAPVMALAVAVAAPAFAGLVLAASQPTHFPRLCRALEFSPLRFLGRYSYGLYLLQPTCLQLLQPTLKDMLSGIYAPNTSIFIIGSTVALVSIASAVLMFHVLEAPVLKLKRHFVAARVDQGRS